MSAMSVARVLTPFAALCLVLPVAGRVHASEAARPSVKVGFVTTLSGPGAAIGADLRDGFGLALKSLGGRLGGSFARLGALGLAGALGVELFGGRRGDVGRRVAQHRVEGVAGNDLVLDQRVPGIVVFAGLQHGARRRDRVVVQLIDGVERHFSESGGTPTLFFDREA